MHPLTGLAIYFVLWWLVLFAVLPFGTRPVADPDSQTGWRGAPAQPRVARKMLVTTIVTAILWGLLYLAITNDLLNFRDGVLSMP
jgi:predicted secreted protein